MRSLEHLDVVPKRACDARGRLEKRNMRNHSGIGRLNKEFQNKPTVARLTGAQGAGDARSIVSGSSVLCILQCHKNSSLEEQYNPYLS
jgi:hypothetical protein